MWFYLGQGATHISFTSDAREGFNVLFKKCLEPFFTGSNNDPASVQTEWDDAVESMGRLFRLSGQRAEYLWDSNSTPTDWNTLHQALFDVKKDHCPRRDVVRGRWCTFLQQSVGRKARTK
jgi:hypothetical protein